MRALVRLDGEEAERIIALQLAALGPIRFARQFAVPLLAEVGRAWMDGQVCVASEHLASGLLRSLLGSSLRALPLRAAAPVILFTTLPGERHELGLLIAALTAVGAGGRPLYLGPDLPVEEIAAAASTTGAGAVALSVVSTSAARVRPLVVELRDAIPQHVDLWLGGAGSAGIDLPPGVDRLISLDALDARVGMLEARLGGAQR
jgi:methanogenic corrinoid protein MtbC1